MKNGTRNETQAARTGANGKKEVYSAILVRTGNGYEVYDKADDLYLGSITGCAAAQMTERLKQREKQYAHEWTTAEEVIANLHTKRRFGGWGVTTLTEVCGTANPGDYRKAHELWLKLKEAFNAEAAAYKPEAYNSRLASIGDVTDREVMRSAWWDELYGDDYGDYDTLTTIIEVLHGGE